ncbi:MAG: hypothetical protein INR69_15270 [Mucilaginibacter polytrichastri]|nr:hypothetical protein [Mucilaginibacter polytrichastri]
MDKETNKTRRGCGDGPQQKQGIVKPVGAGEIVKDKRRELRREKVWMVYWSSPEYYARVALKEYRFIG